MRSFLTYQRWNSNTVNLHVHILLHLYPCFIFNTFPSCYFQASEEPEERETLALMAARGDSEETQDGETYIEKYTRGVLEVENILSLERLRQVLLKKKKIHTWPTGLWKKLGPLLYRINVEILHKRLYLQRWHPSFSGCDSEGSAQHEGQTPKTEYQHTKCTTCNGLTTHCNTELSLLPECKINCFEIWLDSDSRLLFLQTSCSKTDLTGCEDDDCKVGHSSGDVYRLERNNFMT